METDDGSWTLWNAMLNETYHSGCGAIAESLVVYLVNSGVAERLQQRLETTVFEVGFGTGTNFWLTAACAEICGARLLYEAVDCWLPPPAVFENLRLTTAVEGAERRLCGSDVFAGFPNADLLNKAQTWLEAWCQWRGELEMPLVEATWSWQNVALHLSVMQLQSFARKTAGGTLDAVYFDAFSPQSSPELWTEPVLAQLHAYLKPGGRLVTYCVKRMVQEQLANVGFQVEKLAGPPGGKREVLVAIKPA